MELFLNLIWGWVGCDILKTKMFWKTSQEWWKPQHNVILWVQASPSVLFQSLFLSNCSSGRTAFLFYTIWFGGKLCSQVSHFTVEIWDEWDKLQWLPLDCGWREEKNISNIFRELKVVNKSKWIQNFSVCWIVRVRLRVKTFAVFHNKGWKVKRQPGFCTWSQQRCCIKESFIYLCWVKPYE